MQGWALAALDLAKGAVKFPNEGAIQQQSEVWSSSSADSVDYGGHQWVCVTSAVVAP